MKGTYQFFVFAFLSVIFAIQALASFGKIHPHRYWPFLYYPMYSGAHYQGDTVPNYRFIGIAEDGLELPLSLRDMGLTRFQFRYGVVQNIQKGNVEHLLPYLTFWEERSGVRLTAVKLINDPVGLAARGTFQAPREKNVLLLHGGTR